jgi:hypothetical protein
MFIVCVGSGHLARNRAFRDAFQWRLVEIVHKFIEVEQSPHTTPSVDEVIETEPQRLIVQRINKWLDKPPGSGTHSTTPGPFPFTAKYTANKTLGSLAVQR